LKLLNEYLIGQISDGYGENGVGEATINVRELSTREELITKSICYNESTKVAANLIHTANMNSSLLAVSSVEKLRDCVYSLFYQLTDPSGYKNETCFDTYVCHVEPKLNVMLWARESPITIESR
jgi:hypothetical protein